MREKKENFVLEVRDTACNARETNHMAEDEGRDSNFSDVWKKQIAQVGTARKPHQRVQVGRETGSGASGVQSSQEAGKEKASRPEAGLFP